MGTFFIAFVFHEIVKSIDTTRNYKRDSISGKDELNSTHWLSIYDWLEPHKVDFYLRKSEHKSGFYIIRENKNIVYYGYSGVNLYKTILRHFQKWTDTSQPNRKTYNARGKKEYEVKIYYLNPLIAKQVESILISRDNPRDNTQKAKINTSAKSRLIASKIKPRNVLKKKIDTPF